MFWIKNEKHSSSWKLHGPLGSYPYFVFIVLLEEGDITRALGGEGHDTIHTNIREMRYKPTQTKSGAIEAT